MPADRATIEARVKLTLEIVHAAASEPLPVQKELVHSVYDELARADTAKDLMNAMFEGADKAQEKALKQLDEITVSATGKHLIPPKNPKVGHQETTCAKSPTGGHLMMGGECLFCGKTDG